MYRNQYDTDVVTWSPDGRIYQVEYAKEALKQGLVVLGLRSDNYAVVASLRRPFSELSAHQKKIFEVDQHCGIAFAGLTADARVLLKFMQQECLSHKYVYGEPLPVSRLVDAVGDKCQIGTQRSWRRPYGVGLIMAGYDSLGPRIYETCPSGSIYEHYAVAIGARAQAAKTYLEKKFKEFPSLGKDELIFHALTALRESLQSGDLTTENCSVAVVGKDTPFTIYQDEAVQPYISQLESRDEEAAGAEGQEGQEGRMETD
eukprot:TRINITY_DN44_c0_g1::TRINITY_DN44_c0_g1_i1::g.14729::m.14729 TRINITY_DN44_c0_g1::TRINITY_DN44_c0_g1_i1::g.14729  ORF type:complete len:259 (-),score=47.51,sp/Q9R1P4/PSA1_MOUSE/56.56/5e-99,Proteasome/PF00227.21/2.3e-51,Proteasome_A_N/PF10584.4/2.8e-11 TRINITY_DN44_c0_g1_i1:75-851(-)